jgi:DNA processing protein
MSSIDITAATWSYICEPGDMLAGLIRKQLGSEFALEEVKTTKTAKEILELLPDDKFRAPMFISSLSDSLECWRRRLKANQVSRAIDVLLEHKGKLLTPQSKEWPHQLADLGNGEPPALWILGDVNSLKEPLVSVVGARLASDYGLGVTKDLVRYLVGRGYSIVSGGALGIDARAHQSAIEASGKTIAVMAGGIDRLYPAKNLELFSEIKQTGALISEVAPGVAPARWRFLQRNRLIAALGQATLVIEAGYRSGSINTAGHANELDRPVGAVPGPINSVRSAGCHRLIRESRAELISTPTDLLELLEVQEHLDELEFGLTSNEIRALDALQYSEASLEQIALIAGLTAGEAEFAVSRLSNRSLITRTSKGWLRS